MTTTTRPRRLRSAVIVDGDDTLWDTQGLYDAAKIELSDLLACGQLDAQDVLDTLALIDVRNIERYGLSRSRFPQSMVETYERLATKEGLAVDPVLKQRVLQIGRSVFERPAIVHSDAKAFLSALRSDYCLILFTAGDVSVQRRRAVESGLQNEFDSFVVTPFKSDESWTELLRSERLILEDTWSVGNSVRSDINPAARVGLRSVLVHRNTWEYEAANFEPGPIWEAESLTQALEIIRGQDSR